MGGSQFRRFALWQPRAGWVSGFGYRSACGTKVVLLLFVELRELVASETTAGGQFRDFFEVPVLPARQRPVEHACWCRAYIFETMNGVARYEDQRTGAADRPLAVDRQFVKTIDDKENFLLIEVHMVGRAFAGVVPCHDYGHGTGGVLGG